ncbi:NADH-quinone oxidoreductase subunit D [Arachnia propionica]|uniref:NADH-quinone oxidoreductase subunit D n=1 Tax=Arachnia propionica TaxID=1750 RepID=A0A3P1T5V3_9ACTN|nr:NADH-quinone oxidoreductase subunit D [Arachnia propionica]MDO5083301.1 NADH-quinone oxidoreductase subunit D [Arachnia propionica]RRD03793.1 NADH-quinone oxidoreductase subunit D [Arachnia propionica]
MSNDIFGHDVEADRVYLAQGGDWGQIAAEQAERGDEVIVVNMGPQHPSTHGVLRLILEMDGETVTHIRPGIGFLHTGIEKNMEFKTWTQGVAFCTRMDYVAPLFNEAVYCLAVEKLLGITDDIPERASVIRVLMMELNRIASHLVAMGTGGMEIGALTVMTIAFREREMILDFFEAISGTRMNHAFIRPGGVACDLPEGGIDQLRDVVKWLRKHLPEYEIFCNENPIFKLRMEGVAKMDLTACMMMGVTGPILRSTGYDWDLRKTQPYCGYETYDFESITWDTEDAYGRFRIRIAECWESLKIVEQCIERLERTQGQPVMVGDKKIAWPASLSLGPDGQGNSFEHVKHIMGESMEALIHHFKIVTEGFKVPVGQVYQAIESPKGELGCHLVSDGGTRPYRAHFRDPGFNHLQAVPLMCEGAMISDVVVAVASIDPVLGGVDR